jgi:hypothetical protein
MNPVSWCQFQKARIIIHTGTSAEYISDSLRIHKSRHKIGHYHNEIDSKNMFSG